MAKKSKTKHSAIPVMLKPKAKSKEITRVIPSSIQNPAAIIPAIPVVAEVSPVAAVEAPVVAEATVVAVETLAVAIEAAPVAEVPVAEVPVAEAPVTATPVEAVPVETSSIEAAPIEKIEAVVVEIVPAAPDRSVELIAALDSADADIAREAAVGLGYLGNAAAVEPLIAVVENAQGFFHPVVRAGAIWSLGQLRDGRATESLLKAISDPMAEASIEAAVALGNIPGERAIEGLREVVRDTTGFYAVAVRRAAIQSLVQAAGPDAVNDLQIVADDTWENPTIRDAARQALA